MNKPLLVGKMILTECTDNLGHVRLVMLEAPNVRGCIVASGGWAVDF